MIAPAQANGQPSSALFSKVVITGKSSGKKDDLMMAFGIVLHYMYKSILRDEVFLRRCEASGLSAGG